MDIRKVAFTGSTLVGRSILQTAARTNLKKVTLELGGKGPSIVFQDADFESALFWTSLGISVNNGQVCAAGSRIYVQSPIYERFLEDFARRTSSRGARFGDPTDSETTKGPVISTSQRDKILGYIAEGKKTGAKLLYGGDVLEGNFVSNTAFANVGETDKIMTEEIFGPVAVSQSVNRSRYLIKKDVLTDPLTC